MKKINNEQILDRIYDLADSLGLKIDAFMDKLEDDYSESLPDLEGLPEDIVKELTAARANKKEMKRLDRQKKTEAENAEEIKKFRQLFPDVDPDEIPESVWEEVGKGIGLSHAYALYKVTQEDMNKRAENINARNEKMGAGAKSDGSTEPIFTKELVEKMSGKDIKSNYKNILKAMKNWRF